MRAVGARGGGARGRTAYMAPLCATAAVPTRDDGDGSDGDGSERLRTKILPA